MVWTAQWNVEFWCRRLSVKKLIGCQEFFDSSRRPGIAMTVEVWQIKVNILKRIDQGGTTTHCPSVSSKKRPWHIARTISFINIVEGSEISVSFGNYILNTCTVITIYWHGEAFNKTFRRNSYPIFGTLVIPVHVAPQSWSVDWHFIFEANIEHLNAFLSNRFWKWSIYGDGNVINKSHILKSFWKPVGMIP